MALPGYDAWKLDSGYRDMTDQEIEIDRLETRIKKLTTALEECAEYFDNRSDVLDGPEGTHLPNKEMRLLQMIQEVL